MKKTVPAQAWVNSWPPAGPSAFLFTIDRGAYFVGTKDSRRAIECDQGNYPFPTAWSWDGARLADTTHIWDVKTGALLTRLNNPAQQHTPDQVAWSPDGTRLASADSLSAAFREGSEDALMANTYRYYQL